MNKNVLLAIFITYAHQLLATSCPQLLAEILSHRARGEVTVIIDETLNGVNPQFYIDRYNKTLDFAQDSGLRIPPQEARISIVARNEGNLRNNPDLIDITVPYQWKEEIYLDGSWTYHTDAPAISLPLFDHEVGHAIFRENALDKSRKYAYFLGLQNEEQRLAHQALTIIEEYEKGSSTRQKQLEPILIEMQKKLSEIKQEMGSFDYVYSKNKLIGMDELFADTTAVMAAKDGRAMSNVRATARRLNERGPSPELDAEFYDSNIYRDFTHPNNKLSNWRVDSDEHAYFAPVRYFLYENYLQHSCYMDGEETHRLYHALFNAIMETSEKVDYQNQLTPHEFNALLIENIKKRMQ